MSIPPAKPKRNRFARPGAEICVRGAPIVEAAQGTGLSTTRSLRGGGMHDLILKAIYLPAARHGERKEAGGQ